RVTLSQHQSSDSVPGVRIEVSDSGIGIARDKLAAMFDKFTQADASTTRQYGGTGLGLAISQSLAQHMGGNIQVKSTPGEGSSFTIILPLRQASKARLLQLNDISDTPDRERLHAERSRKENAVLLVEDYSPNILVASAMLEQFGYNYEVAH